MEILESYDLTRSAWSAAQLVGCDAKTVQRYVDLRDAGRDPYSRVRRTRIVDPFVEGVEELVERSNGGVRADVVHERLVAMGGYSANERTTRRAVGEAKRAFGQGQRRTYRPWQPEPGMWAQFDWGWGPVVRMRQTTPTGAGSCKPRLRPQSETERSFLAIGQWRPAHPHQDGSGQRAGRPVRPSASRPGAACCR